MTSVHAIVPRVPAIPSMLLCSSITIQATQIIQEAMALLSAWLVLPEIDGQSWKRNETMDLRFARVQGDTPDRDHFITFATHDLAQT